MQTIKWIVAVLVVALGASFSLLNAEIVHFNYYFGRVEIALSLIILIALVVGFVLGWIASAKRLILTQYKLHQAKKTLEHI